jgi:subfamily B ATP-binding cassette protein MsbA
MKLRNSEYAKPLKIKNADINFNNINFSYEENEGPTLQSINLKFEGGKMTSLVGHSGSGKSTILNLIPRIFDAKSGDIFIDNQSIYNSTIESLRSEISMVSQETTLFDDTIKNNIKYGRQEATDNEVFEVAKLSYCDEFINKSSK